MPSTEIDDMSPREKHIPDSADRTTIRLTAEERAAIYWIKEFRRSRKNKRFTTNDILVDGLWLLLEQTGGLTKDQISLMVPRVPSPDLSKAKVAEMPKPKGER